MIVMESRHGRRFVVRIDRGEDVVASLKKLAQSERIRAAWVRGTGLCEWAELTDWDPSRELLRVPRHIEGPLALLSCEGNISMRLGEPYVELRGALSREGDAGLVVLGGQLVVASSLNVELVIDVFEDVRLERDEERETGLSVWKGERTQGAVARAIERRGGETSRTHTPPTSREPTTREVSAMRGGASARAEQSADDVDGTPTSDVPATPAALGWADVARASAEGTSAPRSPVAERRSPTTAGVPLVPIFDKATTRPAPSDDEPQPKKGDWIDHRQFGLCRVEGENVDGGLLIRLASGMRKVVHTEHLEVMPARYEGERRIFPLRPRKR